MCDTVIKMGNSIIQHGRDNDRAYLMKLNDNDMPDILMRLDELARRHRYTKIFAKVPERAVQLFINDGYIEEARIPNFYNGMEDGIFLAKYFSAERKTRRRWDTITQVLKTALKRKDKFHIQSLGKDFYCRKAGHGDAGEMASVYEKVFATYPFPIHEPSYIKSTMDKNIEYFGIWHSGRIVALSSSEMDLSGMNVEMTDFATLPEYRGNNFSLYLLNKMERVMKKKEMKTAYTIARAVSYGMNSTFSKAGYEFTGVLINNTNIAGDMENMNVWYKPLRTV